MHARADALRTETPEVDSPDDYGALSVIHDEALNTWFAESFRRFIEYHVLGTEGDDSSGFYGRTVMKAVGIALDERLGPLERQAKQIDELRLQVAQLTGAIDVLRGKEVPDSFNVLRQEILDSVGEALGMARAEIEDTLASQAERIKELELRAAARGAIDVLRGRGLPGGFNVKGTYNATATYVLNDVIACDGGSFVALKDQPGPCPGGDWQRLAGPGRRGHRGPRGFDGAPGADAPRWTGVSFNPEALSFTAKMPTAHSDRRSRSPQSLPASLSMLAATRSCFHCATVLSYASVWPTCSSAFSRRWEARNDDCLCCRSCCRG
jgi:hypothetical protein